MKIYSDRLEFSELKFEDKRELAEIARRMAWNDTINLMLRSYADEKFDKDFASAEPELYFYKNNFRLAVKKSMGKDIRELTDEDKSQLFQKLPMNLIPEEKWHINFSQLKPPFNDNTYNFIKQAIERKNAASRTGYWFAIRDKNTQELMGASIISSREITKDGKKIVGHSGQFIDPKFQKKGYISEAKAVMVDFMYQYADFSKQTLSPDAFFYTTCNKYNVGSQALQNKSGARSDGVVDAHGKLHYFASKEEIYASRLMSSYTKGWQLEMDNGRKYTVTKENPLKEQGEKENMPAKEALNQVQMLQISKNQKDMNDR